MAAISKAWVTIADAAVDPDSPLDATLMTGMRDDLVHLREWLGASFTAGAVQNHNHDGVNSAAISIGPNATRNGSFEEDENGWTLTDFTGGAHAISAATRHHGAKSLSITSTVLANGGGEAQSNEYVPIGESSGLLFQVWRSASVANVSSKAEVQWYDAAKGAISTVSIFTDTNTPTTPTRARVRLSSPANARFWRLKLTGGIPATGAATGTIFFDGVTVSDWSITQAYIEPAAVGTAELKTALNSTSVGAGGGTSSGHFSLAGGEYCFSPTVNPNAGSGAESFGFFSGGAVAVGGGGSIFNLQDPTAAAIVGTTTFAASRSTQYTLISWAETSDDGFTLTSRYVQASPPYDLGNGEIPLFAFLAIDKATGAVKASWVAQDPPWANNGRRPWRRRAQFYRAGKPYRLERQVPDEVRVALRSGSDTDRALALAAMRQAPFVEVEITQAMKNEDMNLVPNPIHINGPENYSFVMAPIGAALDDMRMLSDEGEDVAALLVAGKFSIGNVPLDAVAPAGVMVVDVGWKLTR